MKLAVIDLDHNGPAATTGRLLSLGAKPDNLRSRDHFRYVEPEDGSHLVHVVKDLIEWQPDVVVVDSLGELLPLFGSSSNSADDFTSVHSRVLKPLAACGAAVILIDHLAKGTDSRASGPGGTAAKRRAIGGVSIRVAVNVAFTPGSGGSAWLTINKDRHGGLRQHCPTGDREPTAGLFRLRQISDTRMVYEVKAPDAGDNRAPTEVTVPSADIEAIAALVPPPTSQRDARERLKWRTERTSHAMKAWKEKQAHELENGVFPVSHIGGPETGNTPERHLRGLPA
ncbi:hypothetical protein BJD99_01035 [Rhodococcus sp. 1163]|uniref:hypothetical protein n=1 Tax=Rhodococcus sp. 1163 TaxID=1905289 RepID=UPI000A04728D|nr:hypothetical protein [Rhodococcus sp. 1163]ORI11756.1 hypothetical protein BJD99_01035 [Rhodococcus sp. 1163]